MFQPVGQAQSLDMGWWNFISAVPTNDTTFLLFIVIICRHWSSIVHWKKNIQSFNMQIKMNSFIVLHNKFWQKYPLLCLLTLAIFCFLMVAHWQRSLKIHCQKKASNCCNWLKESVYTSMQHEMSTLSLSNALFWNYFLFLIVIIRRHCSSITHWKCKTF